ncbi:hypothetical protein S245_003787 [Arachis hypogaea]
MANPPPVRPWSRLASLGPTPSKPSPQTQPSQQQTPTSRFRFILGAAGKTSSAPSSPEQKVPSPPNSTSMPNSLIPKTITKKFHNREQCLCQLHRISTGNNTICSFLFEG